MNEFMKIIHNAEALKEDLVILNNVYDDLFKPWIFIDDDDLANEDVGDAKEKDNIKDLDLLYKLRNVLNQTYVTNIGQTKVNNVRIPEKKDLINKKTTPMVRKLPITSAGEPKPKVPLKIDNRIISKKRVFTPAHLSAPFKTDPNMHKPKPKITISRNISTASSSISSTIHTASNCIVKQTKIIEPEVTENNNEADSEKALNNGVVEVDKKSALFSQLREDIKKLELTDSLATEVTMKSVKPTTVLKAGTRLQVPRSLRKECSVNARLQTKIEQGLLENMRIESATAGYKARQRFLDGVLTRRGRMTVERHRARVLERVLDKLQSYCVCLDLPSCTPTQVSFLRACLAWALSEFVDIQSLEALHLGDKRPVRCPDASTDDIRHWLLARSPPDDSLSSETSFYYRSKETVSVTNGGFISARARVGGGAQCVPSLSVTRHGSSPFVFSVDGSRSAVPASLPACRSQYIAVQLHMNMYWGPLLSVWALHLQDRYQNGDNPCSFYRQLYGLLLHRYPVLLRDIV